MHLSTKIHSIIAIVASFFIATIVYMQVDSESLYIQNMDTISEHDIELKKLSLYHVTGFKAGDGIVEFDNFKDLKTYYKPFTLTPLSIIKTDYFVLKPWVDKTRTVGTHHRHRHKESKERLLHYVDGDSLLTNKKDYLRYYFLQIKDGTYVLALIPDYIAYAIDKGDKVKLPISKYTSYVRPQGLVDFAKEHGYEARDLIYSFNDEKLKENSFFLVGVRVLCALLATILFLALYYFIYKKFIDNKRDDDVINQYYEQNK